jgi:hypothetical protein
VSVNEFLSPVLIALASGESFKDVWRTPGPWQTGEPTLPSFAANRC